MAVLKNKENTFTEKNRFLVYSDQLDATVRIMLDTVGEMIARSAIQTFEDEGETIMATDASYLASLTIDGKAVQNGTPTQANPVPIKVVSSKNLFDAPVQAYISSAAGAVTINNAGGTAFVGKLETNTDYIIKSYLYADQNRFRIFLFDADPREQYGTAFTTGHYKSIANINDPANDQEQSFNSESFTWVLLGTSTSAVAYNPDAKAQLESGSAATSYVAPGCIELVIDDTATSINLQGNILASLPDGTKDVLTVDSAGHCVIEKHVSHIASYNGESVGSVYLSTTGELTTGAEVYYKASSTSTVDCGYISMPSIPEGAVISITAQVTPTIAAKWWTRNQSEVASAFSAISSDLASIQSQIDSIDARVTALESANSKALVLEKPETLKEISEEIEETEEQEEMPLEDTEE